MKGLIRGFTLLELMVTIAIIGILSALSIPGFLTLQARAKQAEVKTNLRALYTLEKAFLQENSRYSSLVTEVGFAPERGNRYAYFLGGTNLNGDDRFGTATFASSTATGISVDLFKFGTVQAITVFDFTTCTTPAVTAPPGATFVAAAEGNIDDDLTLDVWSISSVGRSMTACISGSGANVPAGTPANDRDDSRL